MRPLDELLDALNEVDPSSQLRFCWARAFPQIPKSHDAIMGWLMSSHGMTWSKAGRMPVTDVVELLKAEVENRPSKAGAENETTGHPVADHSVIALTSIFTNGVSDLRIKQAAKVADDKSKTVDFRLKEIDELIPFPSTVPASAMATLLGCSKPAIINSPWWQQNRAGKSKAKQREREIEHRERAKRHEKDR